MMGSSMMGGRYEREEQYGQQKQQERHQQGATVRTLLQVMIDQACFDGQDPHALLTDTIYLDYETVAQVRLRNVRRNAITVNAMPQVTATSSPVLVSYVLEPVEPWPVIVEVCAFPIPSAEQARAGCTEPDGCYIFMKRIPLEQPEQFNALLVALHHADVYYVVS
jgi:hypothetical protein